MDKSIQFHSTQYTPIRNKRSRHLLQREDTLNVSPILNDTYIFKTLNDTSLRQVLDETSILVNPTSAGEHLNEEFFEIIQSSRPSNVFETLARLAQVCCDSLELIEPWNRYNVHNYWLAEEANTWKLIHCLYADTITEHPESLENLITQTTLSQQSLVNALFRSDAELRLLQLLVGWLETTAAYQEEATKTSAPVIGNNIHWGNTLHELLIGTSLFNKDKTKALVTCMDPDANRRQKKSLHSDDEKDDSDLCKRIFTEVRCGKFHDAVSLCISAGQAWRGAVLQGWNLLHYLPRDDPSEPLEIKGNPSRDLWKWCALGVANCASENIYYRATLGILSGHLPSALLACQGSWEDILWAHLKVQIEARVDKFLREHYLTVDASTTSSDVLELLQSELHIEEMALQQVLSEVKGLMDGKLESNYQTCQRYLMLGQVRSIMSHALDWLQDSNERFIRFLAHLILILRQMGKDPQHDVGDKVLEKYVTLLTNKLVDGTVETPELIAYYTSTVPFETQTILYANFMEQIHKSEYRQGVVKSGQDAGIDVAASARVAIMKAITDIQEGYGSLEFNTTQTGVIEKDKTLISKVISSLEWLALIGHQLEEALWLSNAMVRTFIFIGNTDAANECISSFNKMFPNFINTVGSGTSELREHLCLKAYLDALEAFGTWYRHFISGKPKDVEPLAPDATFSDKVYHEQRCEQVEQQRTIWMNAVTHQSKHTKNLLYNVLMFPGGWLQDEHDSTSSDKFNEEEKYERSKQLETLRRLCIPESLMLMFKILQSYDNLEGHQEAVKLASLIAGDNRCLYNVFNRSKLMEVLERIKESSLWLLENGRDFLGFEISE